MANCVVGLFNNHHRHDNGQDDDAVEGDERLGHGAVEPVARGGAVGAGCVRGLAPVHGEVGGAVVLFADVVVELAEAAFGSEEVAVQAPEDDRRKQRDVHVAVGRAL